ncbi:MAG: ComEC/Rec2 family competence protein [Elusimicrobiota bacterium]
MKENYYYFFRRPLFWVLIVYCLGIVVFDFYSTRAVNSQKTQEPVSGILVGIVATPPQATRTGFQFVLETESFKTFKEDIRGVQKKVLVLLRNREINIFPGERIQIKGSLNSPEPSSWPGAFDFRKFLSRKNIDSVFYGSPKLIHLGDSGKFSFLKWGWKIKQKALLVFKKYLSEDNATILAGLVLGERPRSHALLTEHFVRSGTMHILVASGSNIGFILFFWALLCHLVWRNSHHFVMASCFIPMWAYVFICGGDAPLIRAALMATIGLINYWMKREDLWYFTWALTAFICLLISPKALFDLGSQMSFLAVFGIVHTMTQTQKLWEKIENIFLKLFLVLAVTGISAQLWVLPISCHTFHRFYPIGFISNLVVSPLSGIGIFLGGLIQIGHMASIEISFLQPFFKLATQLVSMYIHALFYLVKTFSHWGGAGIPVSSFSLFEFIFIYFSLFIFPFCLKRKKVLLIFIVFLMTTLILMRGLDIMNKKQKIVTIEWLKAGRKFTTIITDTQKNIWLLNPTTTSNPQFIEKSVAPFLIEKGARKINGILITKDNFYAHQAVNEYQELFPVDRVVIVPDEINITQLRWGNKLVKDPNIQIIYRSTEVTAGELTIKIKMSSIKKKYISRVEISNNKKRILSTEDLREINEKLILERKKYFLIRHPSP